MKLFGLAAVTGAVLLCLPAGAWAASAGLDNTSSSHTSANYYVAAPGERNDMRIDRRLTEGNYHATFTDLGADITAGPNCTAVNPPDQRVEAPGVVRGTVNLASAVECVEAPMHGYLVYMYVNTGDGDDTIRTNSNDWTQDGYDCGEGYDTIYVPFWHIDSFGNCERVIYTD